MDKTSNKDFIFFLDSPKEGRVYSQTLHIKGWLIPPELKETKLMRVLIGKKNYPIDFGQPRPDVMEQYTNIPSNRTMKSGFSFAIDFSSTMRDFIIEADFGNGYVEVYKQRLSDRREMPFEAIYHPELSRNYANHYDIIEAKTIYYNESLPPKAPPKVSQKQPKLLAFYLPQFYPIDENDKSWGRGFTEWTNVTSATPRFSGHHQPLLPKDLGFYSLDSVNSVKRQIDLAKLAGISGFCIYYYWFSGKKVLDKPLDIIMKNKDWDFNFCICWANENWTKRWDGRDDEIILAQQYKDSDPLDFIKDIEDILIDKRYIRVNNKPMLVIYRPEELRDPKAYINTWRNYFKDKHNLDLHIVSVLSFDNSDPRRIGLDAGIEFMPATATKYVYKDGSSETPKTDISRDIIDKNFSGTVLNYRDLVVEGKIFDFTYDFPSYACVAPSWDNDARRKGDGTVFSHTNPDVYERWLETTLAKRKNDDFVFINAWNEWAEGAILEPTQIFGNAMINRTNHVVASSLRQINNNKKPAVILEINSVDNLDRVIDEITKINPELYGEVYALATKETHNSIAKSLAPVPHLSKIIIPKRGEEVLPFLVTARRTQREGYNKILRITTSGEIGVLRALIEILRNPPLKPGLFFSGKDKLITCSLSETSEGTAFLKSKSFFTDVETIAAVIEKEYTVEDFGPAKAMESIELANSIEALFVNETIKNKQLYKVFHSGKSQQINSISGVTIEKSIDEANGIVGWDEDKENERKIQELQNENSKLLGAIKQRSSQIRDIQNSRSFKAGRVLFIAPRTAKKTYKFVNKRIGIYKHIAQLLRHIKKTYGITQSNKNGKLKVNIVIRSIYHPTSSTFIRLVSPFAHQSLQGKTTIRLVDGERPKIKRNADIVIVQRTAIAHMDDAKKLVETVRTQNMKLFVDTDDAFGELDKTHPQYEEQKERVEALNYIIENADEVWFSTEELKKLYNCKRSIVVRNTIDPKIWPKLHHSGISTVPIDQPLQMVYMGTVTHNEDFEMILPALKKLYRHYPDEFQLHMIGVAKKFEQFPWLVPHKPDNALYPDFVKWFSNLPAFDVGISPLKDNKFNKSKSDIKCLDYLAIGTRPVVSNVPAYKNPELDDLITRVDNTEEDWFNTLEKAIVERKKNRLTMEQDVKKGYDYLVKTRSTKHAAKIILESIQHIKKRKMIKK